MLAELWPDDGSSGVFISSVRNTHPAGILQESRSVVLRYTPLRMDPGSIETLSGDVECALCFVDDDVPAFCARDRDEASNVAIRYAGQRPILNLQGCMMIASQSQLEQSAVRCFAPCF